MATAVPAPAQWALEAESNLFYASDVSLFSASRRLALMEDPTQPVVDVTGQGSDMVFEPAAELKRAFTSGGGKTELSAKGQGFVFAQNPVFNHGTLRVELEQDLPWSSLLRLDYYYAPHLFLARNAERRSGTRQPTDEQVTSHIWSAHLEQRPSQAVTIRLLSRYGLRLYNEAFAQRNTRFWTIGPHVEWAITPRIDLTLGYHYERGLADGRNQPQFSDDVSYVNHYVAVGLGFRLTSRASLFLGFDYERNDFTSALAGDDRRGTAENIYQGEAELKQALTESVTLTAGFQRSMRTSSVGSRGVNDSNLWVGAEYRF
ncbi:MAG: hypothetical protein AB1411_10125 [Nitrospirota bacterium]